MDPVAFSIFGLSVAWYGLLITAGIAVGWVIALRLARARGLNPDLFSDMAFWAILWGVIGARLVFVLTSPGLFFKHDNLLTNLVEVINIRQGGISIHGGLAAGLLVLLYYARRHKVNFYSYAELMVPGVGLGIIGGRLGNIMNGSDTVGRITSWPVGFVWPDWARGFHDAMCNPNAQENLATYCVQRAAGLVMPQPVHFTQIYGVIIGIIVTIASFYWLRSKIPGWAFWQFWLWYSLLRAGWEETFRLNPLTWNVYLSEGLGKSGVGLFTFTQLASIPIVVISIVMLVRLARRPRETMEARRA
ncbi:prolipoprotein diacylglyceryl transferase [Deinococcus yavapaiensis]|uniref:Phosphatidylglycerol--prolipoprotein diacylglyceryl transferase n=1 Tax=Deinococcus yavapaiensis KR-236 TaxID=694435 RepID=A0A318S612_9DEIO|nr:prolipoprotein diacylglyceryl transferase [Deinococcus yavapaiensis]PYE53062.1 phosphatidylglycerol:prolipoprotein diacylglycerol transferase [Deinococcus yavapaiensis KR-236]